MKLVSFSGYTPAAMRPRFGAITPDTPYQKELNALSDFISSNEGRTFVFNDRSSGSTGVLHFPPSSSIVEINNPARYAEIQCERSGSLEIDLNSGQKREIGQNDWEPLASRDGSLLKIIAKAIDTYCVSPR